jgi:IclR family transcriptional regulator, mhp operon transcriptional activator
MLATGTTIGSREDVRLTKDDAPEGEYIRAAERTLQILACMNRRPISTIQDLHRDTGLPKPTLVRFLKTMAHAGYVTNDERQAGYQLTSLVNSLSSGYHGDPLVIEAGRPWAIQITRQLHWPVSIAVLDSQSMVVRFSTVSDSPVSPFHSTINMHLNLFTKALGRAYLAYCDDEQIAAFAAAAERGDDLTAARIAGDRDYLSTLVRSIRRSGYALRDARAEPKNSNTLAVPIFLAGRVRATLGVTFFRSSIKSHEMFRDFAVKLKQVSAQITVDTERLRGAEMPEKLPAII